MKNLLFIVVFAASFVCASAQKVYFIYLQSENYSPFYVKMNDKIYSSTTSGYLIISNLVDSAYNFTVGFPSSQSESRFLIPINSKDRGFLIKNFDAGWGLFDLQNLTITRAQKDDSPKNISYTRRNDDFSFLLSKAANDTSLLYSVVRTKEEDVAIEEPQQQRKEETPGKDQSAVSKDSIAAELSQTNMTSETKKPDTLTIVQSNAEIKKEGDVVAISTNEISQRDTLAFVASKEELKQAPDTLSIDGLNTPINKADTQITYSAEGQIFKRSQIKKHSESSTAEGFGLVFYDTYDGGLDTIRLVIPNPPIVLKQSTENDSAGLQKDFIHLEELKKDTIQQTPIVVAVKDNTTVNSKCKSIASTNDFLRLRKNMAAKNTDEAMVAEAKKFFKSKCFTTQQIKNLSALFLTSAGKYQFFDAAYLHSSDQENFSSLESEIKDDYYLNRFKALIGE